MTPLHGEYSRIEVYKNLLELVKIEYAMKKHFVYMDDIDELKHNERVIRDFDVAIKTVRELMRKLRVFRNKLG